MSPNPPVLARILLRLVLPPEVREVITGDLEETWRADPSRLRYWRMTLATLAAWGRHRLRGGGRVGGGHEFPPRGDGLVQQLIQDLGYGLRLMRRAPGFTAAIVLTLAVGIGANAATFSLVDVMALTPLTYQDPERVAFVFGWNLERQQRRFNLPLADALDIGNATRSLTAVAAYQYWSANLSGIDVPERVQVYRVTANTFELLGVDAAQGRALAAADGRPEAPDVVVLSHGLWQRRFGGAPSIVGQRVTLDGRAHTIVGVMPRRFEFPVFNFKGEAWTPLKFDAGASSVRDGSPSVVAIARLRGGVDYREAQAELDTVMRRLETDYPRSNRGLGARLLEMRRLGEDYGIGSISLVLLLAVAFVLLLACANVANLLLSRAVSREREIGVRAAMGAGRARLVRQLLTESALLSAAGAIAGVALAAITLQWIRGSLPELLLVTQPNILDLSVDRRTLAYTTGLAALSALVFGALPAWRTAQLDLLTSLKSGGHGGGAPRQRRARSALMVAEVAVSVVLLVGAGLLVRGVGRLRHVDPGFNPDSVLTMTISLPEYRYPDAAARRAFFTSAVLGIEQIPGVQSAGFVNVLPLSTYDGGTRYVLIGQTVEAGREPSAAYRAVTPNYFTALQIPVGGGRAFDSRDEAASQPVAIVNRTFARQTFGDSDPIGRQLRLGRVTSTSPPRTIVGVVGDVLHSELTRSADPEIYVPFAQAPGPTMFLAARVAGDPDRFADAVRAALAKIDAGQPVYFVKTMQSLVDAALLPHTTATAIMTVFAGLALVLASVGIYSVTSYAVTQQAREFGVRLALGATPADVLAIVIRRGLTLVGTGTVIGGGLAVGAGQGLAALLPSVRAGDAVPYLAVSAVLLVVGAAACYVPARRAMRLDPVEILKAD
jgi:putative ABC transport system permease protein